MQIIVLSLYPEMFPGLLGYSLPGAALNRGDWSLRTLNIRDYATDKHASVDDTPYGGGAGMVMKPEVVAAAIDAAYALLPDAVLLYPTPRGKVLKQHHILSWMQPINPRQFIFLCGRFEGVDERVLEAYRPVEISIGDYVLFGGEVAAMVIMEAMLRYVPGLLGNPETTHEESFTIGEDSACLLEYPHYTKPPLWRGRAVPDVLLSGHHQRINAWRREQAEDITRKRRADMWQAYQETQIRKKTMS